MSDGSNPLALAVALTHRTEQLCIGLEQGIADIYELVTPVTAELLRWWFGEDACQQHTFNFHPGQKQAILNVIVAHEVLDSPNLKDLYTQVCAENVEHQPINVAILSPFTAMTRMKLAELLGKGDTFTSHDLQSSTLFGDYRVDGAAMNANGYNELLSRLTRRVSQALNHPLPKGNKNSPHLDRPYLQMNTAALAAALDEYFRWRLFDEPFEPFEDEGWRLLLLQPVLDHIVRIFGLALVRSEEHSHSGSTDVRYRRLSEVTKLMVRESASLEVSKCIYTRLPYPTRSGGLERAFIEWAQIDASVEAFCKISENRHDFVRLRYIKNDGMAALYIADFLVRTANAIYLVETKAQQQVSHPDVQRKLKSATTWCERTNTLAPELRAGREWHYALVGESLFHDWREN